MINGNKRWFLLASVAMTLSLVCTKQDFQAKQENYQVIMTSAIKDLHWRRVVNIQHVKDTRFTMESSSDLPEAQFLVYNIDPDNLTSSLLEIHSRMFPDINIVITGEISFVRKVLLQVDRFDELHHYSTDFRHHSKWLVLCYEGFIPDLQHNLTFLENIVLVNTTKTKPYGLPPMMTLIHHPSGNVFTPVQECGADVSMCYFPNVRYGYNNRWIRVMTYPNKNYVIKNIVNNTPVYTGYAIDILQHVAGKLNISFSISEPAEGSWGDNKNGSWDGIVGNLQNKTIDLAASDLTVTKERADVIDYIYPSIYTDGISVLYKTLSLSPVSIIARPLQKEVYVVLFGVTLVVIIIFSFIERFKSKEGTDSATVCGIGPITRAVLRQGTTYSPKTRAGRVLISAWWMFLMIVTGIYSANQAASFSSSERIHPFTTYEEIADSDYYLLNEIPGIASVKFMTFDLPLITNLRKKLYQVDIGLIHTSMEEKMLRVNDGKFALLAYRSTANPLMAADCDLEVIKENIFFEHLAFAVPKQSTLKNDIEKIMYSLRESGTLDMLWRKWFKKRNASTCLRERKVQTISTETITGSFIILACGLVLCVIVLCCELLIHRFILAQMMNLRTNHRKIIIQN